MTFIDHVMFGLQTAYEYDICSMKYSNMSEEYYIYMTCDEDHWIED